MMAPTIAPKIVAGYSLVYSDLIQVYRLFKQASKEGYGLVFDWSLEHNGHMADRLQRRQLDARLSRLRTQSTLEPPHGGWIRAIRRSLGMTAAQLGQRMGKVPQTIRDFEESEARGAITLKSLESAARALNCTLVYALVPKRDLEEMVRDRARQVAAERIQNIEQTMRLENQALPLEQRDARIEDLADELVRRDIRSLWRDTA